MKGVANFFSDVGHALNPSKSTFSGAMDIVVIQSPEGFLNSTPFYVKFGKFKSIGTREGLIEVKINHNPTGVLMKLTNCGKAIFCRDQGSLFQSSPKDHQEDPKNLCPLNHSNHQGYPIEQNLTKHKKRTNSAENLVYLQKEENFSDSDSLKVLQKYLENQEIELTAEELALFSLKPGLNIISYEFISDPEITLNAKIYLWSFRSKLIISDIDGTVTKSDILGHLFYMIKKDWKTKGVVDLYMKLRKKGYQIIYLSARAMDQIDYTRQYLAWIVENEKHMPDGPVLLSPNGLFTSFAREITNSAHNFKINSLKQILSLFPVYHYPFYAGFGNRKGDAIAYFNSGIDSKRIFIVTSKKKHDQMFRTIEDFRDIIQEIEEKFPVIDD